MELKTTEQITLEVLKRNEKARNNDFILYGAVLKEIGVDLNISLKEFLAFANQKGMPSFETVTRCRRLIQHQMPELSNNKVKNLRILKEREFINYGRTKVGNYDF